MPLREPSSPQSLPAASAERSLRHGSIRLYGMENAWLLPLSPAELRERLSRMLAAAFAELPGHALFDVELVLVRDGSMAACNRSAMNCTGPTNILSFPVAGGQGKPQADASLPLPIASLVLSVDTLRREAVLFHQSPQNHLLRLLAHGIGHLMGFQHSPQMFFFCDNILK